MQRPERLALEAHALRRRRQQRTGESTRRTSTSANPRGEGRSSTPSAPRENGPGWPGSGGGSSARRRMMPTGTEKKALASGGGVDDDRDAAAVAQDRSACRRERGRGRGSRSARPRLTTASKEPTGSVAGVLSVQLEGLHVGRVPRRWRPRRPGRAGRRRDVGGEHPAGRADAPRRCAASAHPRRRRRRARQPAATCARSSIASVASPEPPPDEAPQRCQASAASCHCRAWSA